MVNENLINIGLNDVNPGIVTGASVSHGLVTSVSKNNTVALTPIGGIAVALINKSGSPSVKGSVVSPSTEVDGAFILQSNEFDAIGVVYEGGVADGGLCFVVVAGVAEVLLKDETAGVRGYWVKAADTDGRAQATTAPDGVGALVVSEHFREIGHCLESVDAGTNVLAMVILHFN